MELRLRVDRRDGHGRGREGEGLCLVEGLRFRVLGLGFRIWGLGFRVQDLGFATPATYASRFAVGNSMIVRASVEVKVTVDEHSEHATQGPPSGP